MNRRGFLTSSLSAGALAMASDPAMARQAGRFYMPAEEAPHQQTFMQWPSSRKVYRRHAELRAAQRAIANIANAVSQFELVIMLAAAEDHADARNLISGNVILWDIPTEDLWCRDSGPIFVANDAGDLAVAQIQFNGWGRKQVHHQDAQIAKRVADTLGLKMIPSGLIGEGGSTEQDGHGLLMAHESSWVIDNRNPGLSRDEIERRLLATYGADRMIWAKGVKGLDITDYHIDSLARFTGPGKVLMNLPDEPDPDDPFHSAALDTHDALVAAGLSVDVIPEPNRPRIRHADFVASYVNYFVCNGGVIGAEFGDPETDAIARDALERHYPGREVVLLNVDILGELGGGIHCATQQMPAG